MQTPKLDGRDRRDIMDQLKALARSYVPEWRWDEEHPDAGMVLAHVYAAMMENPVSKYNRTMYNHFLSFLNLLGTRLLPPAPAEGMVTVEVLPDGGEVYLPQGTVVGTSAYGMNVVETGTNHILFQFDAGKGGALGILPPATSAMLHNLSTLGVSLRSMGRLTARTQSALGNNSRNG